MDRHMHQEKQEKRLEWTWRMMIFNLNRLSKDRPRD